MSKFSLERVLSDISMSHRSSSCFARSVTNAKYGHLTTTHPQRLFFMLICEYDVVGGTPVPRSGND